MQARAKLRRILIDVRAIIEKSDIILIGSVILMYQNENLQETCDCQVLSKDHELFLITFEVGCESEGLSGKITKNLIKIAFSLIYPI